MNANFGLILCQPAIVEILLPLPPVIRTWGDEQFECGEKKYMYPQLRDIEFQFYPLTEFVERHLPPAMQNCDLVYTSLLGKEVDVYEEWVRENDLQTQEVHRFEKGLIELIRKAKIATIMFAPEGERLGEYLMMDVNDAIDLLRMNIKTLEESEGFLATVLT